MNTAKLKLIPTFLFTLFLAALSAQPAYWQQEVRYFMEIDFDHKDHRFAGSQKLVYFNHSPDTLHKIYYHLYFNAFQPGSMMDERSRSIADPDRRVGDRIYNLKKDEIGYNRILTLGQNGKELSWNTEGTVAKVILNEALLPGDSAVFDMTFEGQVPVQIRRSGRNNVEGIDYTMTQWYPKLVEYDRHGWHPDQYVGREFYGVWGSFDVKITIDKKYTIGGTGVLQNPQEIGKGYYEGDVPKSKDSRLTWHFRAENVHDFAWAADPKFKHTSVQVPNGPLVHMFYSPKTANEESWEQLPELAVKYFQFMDTTFGKYPYSQFSVIQGGDGGMEYPMCTMVRGNGRSFKGFFGLFVHETVHNWYYGIIGNNENRYPWMDEGFTSFAEAEVMNVLYPEDDGPTLNPHINAYGSYLYMIDSLKAIREPMNLGSDFFNTNMMYARTAYTGGELYVNQLRYIVGEEAFWKGMKTYFNTYRFRHPEPDDFLRIMEKASDMELDWFPQFWFNTTRNIDYAVKKVDISAKGHTLVLENKGNFPMPVDVLIVTKSGEQLFVNIPLRMQYGSKKGYMEAAPWPWTRNEYQLDLPFPGSEVKAVVIDPYRMMCDVDLDNNTWIYKK